jgi:hypothetical protein
MISRSTNWPTRRLLLEDVILLNGRPRDGARALTAELFAGGIRFDDVVQTTEHRP